MHTDITEDQRIGPEILKQTAELYRRLRNTLRWLLGSLDRFSPAEHLPEAEMPELERYRSSSGISASGRCSAGENRSRLPSSQRSVLRRRRYNSAVCLRISGPMRW